MTKRLVGRGRVFQDDQFLTGVSCSLWVEPIYKDGRNQWAINGQLMILGADPFILTPLIAQQKAVNLVLMDQSRLEVSVVGWSRMTGLYTVAGEIPSLAEQRE